MALTAKQVEYAKPGKHHDGSGLYLVVTDNSKKWVQRGTVNGKRREWGLGAYKDIGLAEVREKSSTYRRMIKDGTDPAEERKREQAEAQAQEQAQSLLDKMPTFQQVALMVHKENEPTWKNPKDAKRWLTSLEQRVFPTLGDTPIDVITAPMVRDVLAEIWLTIPHTARKIKQRIGTILDYAHISGWREQEAPLRSITKGLPKQSKKTIHLAAMKWGEVPNFIANISTILTASDVVLRAIEFTILTASRSGEVRLATWDEIDFNTATWTRPEDHMKAGKEHRVPLTSRMIEVLGEPGNGLLFPGTKMGRPLSDMSLTMPLRRAELKITMHGFRSTFRDWCAEATNTPREVAEACLAHTIQNQTERAYARSDLFDKRRKLMDRWSAYCCAAGNVTALRAVE
jgi:integrase